MDEQSNLWRLLKETLDNLSKSDFNEFKHYLHNRHGIMPEKLKRAQVWDTVDLIKRYFSNEAGNVMVSVLEEMKQNHCAIELKKKLTDLMDQTSSIGGRAGDRAVPWWRLDSCNIFNIGAQGTNLDQDVTVVLLGKIASGKSAAGNTILGGKFFTEKRSSSPVTQQCVMARTLFQGNVVAVIDTPGLASNFNDRLRADIEPFLQLGPHVFLLVVRVNDPVPGDLRNAVSWIEENLGRDVLCYAIILFTYVDQLQDTPLEEYCRSNQLIRRLINSCGGRRHSFSNDGRQDRSQVHELIEKINNLVWWNFDQARYNRSW